MKKYFEILKKCPLFYGIGEDDLLRMLTCFGAKVVSFDKKFTIFAEGKSVKHIGIVLSGSVQVVQMDYYGNRSILSVIGEGDMFAEAFACAEEQFLPVSIIAGEPSEVMLIECSHILHTCKNNCGFHGQLIFNLMKELANKTIMFHKKLDITSKRSTRDKLMTYLVTVAKEAGTNSFEIPFDRQELADYLGVDRSGLSAEIGKLKNEGIIENRKNRFVIL
ncbi:MAG: Crp/Fnr family transcriptional regulator [Ruminococcaceae bacterium]|nr:Crp/Fnr family transcriptional regulator [Oscillospiraceae bacterium]